MQRRIFPLPNNVAISNNLGAMLQPCITTQSPIRNKAVNGGYGPWSEYGACSQTCRTSGLATPTKTRVRVCDNPSLTHGGLDCVNNRRGEAHERVPCTELQVR